MPSKWRNIHIGGLDVGVLFVSTDHHFSILLLVTLLERKLKRILRKVQSLEPGKGSSIVEEIRADSLKRLTLYQSFSKHQLLINFCSVKTYILSHPQSSVVIIDSLTAYYWEDRMTSTTIQSLEQYCQALLNHLIEKLRQTNITIIYTIQRFLREGQEKDSTNFDVTYNYAITLDKGEKFEAVVEDRRTPKNFTRNFEMIKGELCFNNS